MMKKWENTFNNNHQRLMRVHIGLMVFYTVFFLLCSYFLYQFDNDELKQTDFLQIFMPAMFGYSPLFILHLLLAVGAKNKLEVSRKLSEIVFVIMLLGFPIGTILSAFYFLPKTVWKNKESE